MLQNSSDTYRNDPFGFIACVFVNHHLQRAWEKTQVMEKDEHVVIEMSSTVV